MEGQYIWMNGWERFQTFQTKRGKLWTPPWIKHYTGLLDNPDYIELAPRRRAILHGLWLVMGRCPAGGRLVLGSSPAKIGRIIADDTVRKRDIDALNHAGWVDLCSRTVLEQRWVAFWNCSEQEVELRSREEEPRASTSKEDAARANVVPLPTPTHELNGKALVLQTELLRDMPL